MLIDSTFANIEVKPLTEAFGVELLGIDLASIDLAKLYPALRALFEKHSALLLRGQQISSERHVALARMFGPLEDRASADLKAGDRFEASLVSNVLADGSVSPEDSMHSLHLKANMLWHADSTFLPVPALTNLLIARTVTSEGGETELASTRVAWAEMPEALRARIRGRGVYHHYMQSRAQISEALAREPMFQKWPETHWNSVWTNPSNGREALYIASHARQIDGYSQVDSQALLAELTAFCTQPRYVYSHRWQPGDLLIWDQRAILHRGRPWPHDQRRTLASICTSATVADGLETMRMSDAA